MIFQYQRNSEMIEVLNDVMRIHNDRIAVYKCALTQCNNIDVGLCNAFEEIISDSRYYQDQLAEKIKLLNGNPLKGSSMLGKIYKAWMALKISFPGNTQKAIINSCLYNEEIALHAYNAALSANIYMDTEVRQLIERQEHELRKIYAMVNKYREAKHIIDYKLAFFI